jgi:hypothetical protein
MTEVTLSSCNTFEHDSPSLYVLIRDFGVSFVYHLGLPLVFLEISFSRKLIVRSGHRKQLLTTDMVAASFDAFGACFLWR